MPVHFSTIYGFMSMACVSTAELSIYEDIQPTKPKIFTIYGPLQERFSDPCFGLKMNLEESNAMCEPLFTLVPKTKIYKRAWRQGILF